MSVTVRARPDGPEATCPFCRDPAGEDVTPCACGVRYHPDCRAELSRCATIGCAGKSTGGPRGRTAHRDVSCARCKGLIRNDGDMCFGCWSPFHRTCLADAGGCCGPTRVTGARSLPSRALRRLLQTPVTSSVLIIVPVWACTTFGRELGLAFYTDDATADAFVRKGALIGAVVGIVIAAFALLMHDDARGRRGDE